MENFMLCWCFLCLCFGNIVGITDEDYKKLPKIYEMDNYRKCRSEENLYCKFKFKVNPKSEDSQIWKLIEETKKTRGYYNYDNIYRSKCLPKEMNGKTDEIIKNVSLQENFHFQKDSLSVKVLSTECLKYEIDLTPYDYVVGLILIAFGGAVIYATIIDYLSRKNNKENSNNNENLKAGKIWVPMLSMLAGWEKLKKPITNPDYQKLKAMQGVRTYNMCFVIIGHTLLSFNVGYLNDPFFLENFDMNIGKRAFKYFLLHIVQANYVLSAWLYSNYLYSHLETHKTFTFKDALKIITYRYLRLFPLLAYMIIIHRSRLFKLLFNGPHFEFADIDYINCQQNWFSTLFLVSTIFHMPGNMCNFGSWYLANEFQAFIIFSFLFYFKLKFKFGPKFYGILLAFSILIHSYHIYVNDLNVIFIGTPEECKLENFLKDYAVYVLYTAPYSNFASYIVGFIFGSIYYKYKKTDVKITKWLPIVWLVGFFGLPSLSITLSLFSYPKLLRVVIAGCLKPIFATGIAIGVLGMAFNIGGIVKKICELELVEFIAQWTYTTYLTHFAITFSRSMTANEPRRSSEWDIFSNLISDLILSWMAGLVLHLLVERPLINATNKLLGFDRKQKEKINKNKVNGKNE